MASASRAGVRTFRVPRDRDGQRLDNLLMREMKGAPRSLVYRLIRKGQVRVNGSRCKPQQRLATGDEVRIPPFSQGGGEVPVPAQAVESVERALLWISDDFVALDKPSGMAVHGGSGLPWGLIDAVKASRKLPDCELVHRLDRETSGCLLLARHRRAQLQVQDRLKAGAVHKRYLCLLQGRLAQERQCVDLPLDTAARSGGERHVRVDEEQGKRAVTWFNSLESVPAATYAAADIETGRTHQIRVHAAHCGHPLAGDTRYGDPAWNEQLGKLGLRRLFLHCSELRLDLDDGEEVLLHCELPPDLKAVLEAVLVNS